MRPAAVIPRDLLQPESDTLKCPAAQLGRWLGLPRITPPATRLELPGVRGACAAYSPPTSILAVLDQEAQALAFVDLDRCHGGGGGNSGGSAVAAADAPAAQAVHVVAVPEATTEQELERDVAAAAAAAAAAEGDAAAPQGAAAGAQSGAADESCKLQVVAACGEGRVATGHPDGRVLVWDTARRGVELTLPAVEGCGRGAVLALAADGRLVAAAYAAEVLVWELPPPPPSPQVAPAAAASRYPGSGRGRRLSSGGGSGGGGGGEAAAPQLLALIKPTLTTAVRSMSLSARHGVLALRSVDGVELRAARGGRWLHGFTDRRNTTLLAAGDVLFVASSSPSFLGNNFLEFGIEVAAVDLAAVAARYDGGHDDGGGSSGGGGDGEGRGAGGGVAGIAAASAVGGGGDGGGVPRAQRHERPMVVRTVSPTLRYDLRGAAPLTEFKWDEPLQAALSGGRLLLRCLQFPLAPGRLAWPGLFAYRVADLVDGLALGSAAGPGAEPGSERAAGAGASSGSPVVDTGAEAEAEAAAAPPPPPQQREVAEAVEAARRAPGQGGAAAPPPPPPPPQQQAPAEALAAAAAPAVPCRTLPLEVLCSDWSAQRSGGGGNGAAAAAANVDSAASDGGAHCGCHRCCSGGGGGGAVPSVQLLAAPRHLVLVSPCRRVWLLDIPFTGPRRDVRVTRLRDGPVA